MIRPCTHRKCRRWTFQHVRTSLKNILTHDGKLRIYRLIVTSRMLEYPVLEIPQFFFQDGDLRQKTLPLCRLTVKDRLDVVMFLLPLQSAFVCGNAISLEVPRSLGTDGVA